MKVIPAHLHAALTPPGCRTTTAAPNASTPRARLIPAANGKLVGILNLPHNNSFTPTLHVSHRTHCFERVLDAGAVTDARFGSSIDRETRIRPGAHRTSPVPGSRALECRLELALLPPLVALLFSFSAFFPLEKMWHLHVCERSEEGTYRAWTYLVFVILCLFRVICAAPRTPSVMFATAKPLGSQLL